MGEIFDVLKDYLADYVHENVVGQDGDTRLRGIRTSVSSRHGKKEISHSTS